MTKSTNAEMEAADQGLSLSNNVPIVADTPVNTASEVAIIKSDMEQMKLQMQELEKMLEEIKHKQIENDFQSMRLREEVAAVINSNNEGIIVKTVNQPTNSFWGGKMR